MITISKLINPKNQQYQQHHVLNPKSTLINTYQQNSSLYIPQYHEQIHMKPSLVITLLLLTLLTTTQSLNIFLPQPSTQPTSPKRCYYTTVYREERLLIELDVPLLKAGLELVLEVGLKNVVQKGENKIVLKESIKDMKYKKTVEKESYNTHQIPSDTSLQYQTCIYIKSTSPLSTTPNTDFQTWLPTYIFGQKQAKLNTQSYLISLKLLKNFTHILQDKRDSSAVKLQTHAYTKEHLEVLQERSSKLLAIAREQVKMHRENEKTEMKTEEHVKNLENSIYAMSLTQSGLLVCGSLMHINLMRAYLKGSGMV